MNSKDYLTNSRWTKWQENLEVEMIIHKKINCLKTLTQISVLKKTLLLCNVPYFTLGHNGLITFSIFMRVCQIDAKGQIIAKEENY